MAFAAFVAFLAAAVHAAPLPPLPGDNVNMVSGRAWPGGDPFGQRQNEPSIAVSSVNPQHLLAGANDYRTVDLTLTTVADETSDAWLSLLRSLDGGATWQSVLHPGYPQNPSAANTKSPLYGLGAASDPVVRAGTNGLFYYSGIAFNRGTNVGKVFVSRLIDVNNQESSVAARPDEDDPAKFLDPIKFIDTHVVDTGTSGQFQDKPWVATDIPRKGALTCNIAVGGKTESFPGGNVYFAYATFTGSQQSSSKVYFTRSLDCGQTWATPQKLSESNALNQGSTIAIDPTNGDVWVFWRRFAVPNQGDAIMMARSTNAGATFTKATVLVDLSAPTAPPFDHPDSTTSFRSEAFPAAAISVDGAGKSYVHVAWAQRLANATGTGESRIFITTFDGRAWSTPQPADPGPFQEDDSSRSDCPGVQPCPYLFAHGHQLMPALTFSQGRLMLLYYDSRLDHARRYYQPNPDFLTDGRLFKEWLAPVGANPPGGDGLLYDDFSKAPIFTPFIDDAGLADTRHTVDVRVAELPPGAFAPGSSAPTPASVRVTNFPFGIRSDAPAAVTAFDGTTTFAVEDATNPPTVHAYQQVQSNPPDLPMFAQGTLPFIGDYIDIQGPAFTKTVTGWAWNTAPVPFPVFHAVWTSNQDVRGPPAGTNPATGKPYAWTNYTPPGSISLQPDGSFAATPNPSCNPALSGMRDQNIYTSRITEGLLISSPQNVKSLDVPRAFVVQAQNTTNAELVVTLCLPGSGCAGAPPALPNVDVSFDNLGLATRTPSVTFHVAPHQTAYRSVFAKVTTGTAFYTAIPIAWSESTTGLSGTLTLNPTDANFSLVDVNGATVASETYLASLGSAHVTSAQVTSAQVTSGNVTSAQVTSAQVTSAHVTSGNVTSAQVTSGNVTSGNVTSGNVTSGNVTSGNVTSGNVTSASLPETNYTVTNTGNTTQSYHLKLIGPTVSSSSGLQLILYGTYFTQAVDPFTCGVLDEVPHVYVTSVVNDPPIVAFDDPSLADPATSDGGPANATFVLAPGQTKQITVRGLATPDVTTNVPAVVPHAGGSVAAPLFVASDGAALPTPRLDVAYSATLKAMGGTGPYTWSLIGGSLPPGLALDGAGDLTGTPSQVGSFTCTVQVADSATPTHTAQRVLTLVVATATPTVTLASSPNASAFGQVVTLTATVAGPSGGPTQPTGSVSFYDGCTSTGAGVQPGTLLGGPVALASGSASFTTSALAGGSHALCAAFISADANFSSGTSAVLTQVVNGWTFTGFISPLKAANAMVPPGYAVTSSSGSQRFGSAVPIKWQLQNGTTPLTDPNATVRSLVAYFNPSCTGRVPGTPPWPPPSSTVSYVLFPLTTGNSTFRYDATTNQFIINWDTTKVAAAGCYDIVLTLADGSPPRATAVLLR